MINQTNEVRKSPIASLYQGMEKSMYFQAIKYILLFFILFIAYQLAWKIVDHFLPLTEFLNPLFNLSIQFNVQTTVWILSHVLNIPATANGHVIVLQNWSLEIFHYCEGLKQLLLFIFLMLCFPGKRKAKYWFIPMGVAVLLTINIIRFIGLCLTLVSHPSMFHFMHDQVFYIVYYGGVFGLWAIWEHFFIEKKKIM